MAGHLLLVVLIYSFHEVKVQALLPATLTVNPSVITETDSVTLNCQTPSSVSVSHCFFYTLSGGTVRALSCLKTLTGTELLLMARQNSPAKVEVTCFYTVNLGKLDSPYSDISSITINTPLPPKLTVNPSVITETDSVTLNCQTPSSVSVSQCFFYTLSGGTVRNFSCQHTLTATALLKISHQSSPAVVKVTCHYTVKLGEKKIESPYSEISSIAINNAGVTPESGSEKTGLSVSEPGTKDSSLPVTPLKKAPAGTSIWKLTVIVAGCGVAVGVILLLSAFLRNQNRAAGPEEVKRQESQNQNFDTRCFYSIISEEPAASALGAGPEEVKRRESQNQNFDTYSFYSIISEEPAALALGGMKNSTVQAH
ncbi:uncharacterized protein LOC121179016 [Toxotes jaculatrix]|uniref:uncharacterized protein LOC121179016 n=1 Tax=Toxotes jaculatrix TaxID=941984 RepID=UPI001B3AD9DE|nr:uncharacterized protein LOC121179016 [Toxotes jaculatrix]